MVYSFESDDTAEYTFSEAARAGIYDIWRLISVP